MNEVKDEMDFEAMGRYVVAKEKIPEISKRRLDFANAIANWLNRNKECDISRPLGELISANNELEKEIKELNRNTVVVGRAGIPREN
jgi:hypothetical protein